MLLRLKLCECVSTMRQLPPPGTGSTLGTTVTCTYRQATIFCIGCVIQQLWRTACKLMTTHIGPEKGIHPEYWMFYISCVITGNSIYLYFDLVLIIFQDLGFFRYFLCVYLVHLNCKTSTNNFFSLFCYKAKTFEDV